jgi:transcriptional regulator with XRE-family HTH domain
MESNAMRGSQLKELRKASGLTQAHVAQLLGLTAAYIGELEREEKRIDPRLAGRIKAHIPARIDVGYSRALSGWTVTLVTPNPAGATPGRAHEVMGRYEGKEEALAVAETMKVNDFPFASISVHDNRPPNTTNPNGF